MRSSASDIGGNVRKTALVPTFRSSYTISAITFYELKKAMGTSKFMIPVPLFDLKSLGSFRRLRCRDFKSVALGMGLIGTGGAGRAGNSIKDEARPTNSGVPRAAAGSELAQSRGAPRHGRFQFAIAGNTNGFPPRRSRSNVGEWNHPSAK